MNFKYILFALMFLLIMPIAYANEIKVLYFFGSSCEFSQMEEVNINKVKSYWEGKVSWLDYDLDNKSNIDMAIKYKILGVPSALVECMNKTIKIDREDDYFSHQINETISECQSAKAKGQFEANAATVIALIFLACLFGVYIVRKYSSQHLKKRFRKKKITRKLRKKLR